MVSFRAANAMVKQFDLGASLGKDGAIGNNVCGVGEVIDGEDVDGVWVVFGRPDVDSMSDQGSVEIGKNEPFRGFCLVSIRLYLDPTAVSLSNLGIYDNDGATI